ncbi:MAG: hypothetical protein IT516_17335 [Burkholderiales bacterium]|nr:hypothetical protein [Burkholderiales bacterium]
MDANVTTNVATLDRIETIRQALLIGLASYGEVERLDDEYSRVKEFGNDVDTLKPTYPTRAPVGDSIALFAEALRTLEFIPTARR